MFKVEEIKSRLSKLALIMLKLKKCVNLEKYELINFQIALAECLYDAMSEYKEISQKEREYVAKKEILGKDDFLDKMQKWKVQKLEIKEIISIGKSIGDSYVYIFYRDSIEELEKHYTHPDNGLFVFGIGGRGEIEFIRENPIINGYLVVYHSITNMLRIGDFSLCTLDGKVVGTGEIKSNYIKEERILESSVYMVSKVKLNVDTKEGKEDEKILGNSTKEKIQKQIKLQDNLLKNDFDKKIQDKREMRNQHFLISMACNNKNGIAYNENTVIVTRKKEENGVSENINETIIEKVDILVQKLIKDSEYNNIRVQSIGKEYKPYRKPIIWWDVSDDIIMDVLFNKREIVSIVNLVAYYETLRAEGFTIEFGEKSFIVEKKYINYKVELENFELIEDLITHELCIQRDVAKMISNLVERAYCESQGDTIVRINIKRNF